jgi:uncharacterized protein
MNAIVDLLAAELSLPAPQIERTLRLMDEGGTVPFIARYRKEQTGSLDEVQLRRLADRYAYLRELEQRKGVVLKAAEEQGKLTEELRERIAGTRTKAQLEDLYLPFKPRKRTRATLARERGLEPLAEFLRSVNVPDRTEVDLAGAAAPYVDPEKGVQTPEEALAGAADILAEEVSQNPAHRAFLRDHILEEGTFVSTVRERFPEGTTKFEMYRDYRAPVKSIQPHNVLALRRGERAGVLTVTIAMNEELVQAHLEKEEIFAGSEPVRELLRLMLRDAFVRLMRDSLVSEVRASRKEYADYESIRTFEANLRDVLLAPPAGPKPTLAVDPGLRTGCKLVALDGTGKLLDTRTIFPHGDAARREEAAAVLAELVQKHAIQLVAIGNGTASRETDQFVGEVLAGLEVKPTRVIVNESGASIYSASKAAREEHPELDVTLRGALSIGRRLQDPLAELVKIDPKSIGVGQYQHDVDQRLLRKKLEETVESCVNYVGVDLNTASRHLLKYVAGINGSLAAQIVAWRNEHGIFQDRDQLREVPQMGPRVFEQSAGFLRIRGGQNPLDASAVHPESYEVARRILSEAGLTPEDIGRKTHALKDVDPSRYVSETVGELTVRDILHELQRPGRDPRREFRYAQFKEDVKQITDLTKGMELEGVITNVTNFGAFVDVGVHHDGLVHVSQLADRFVADPTQVVRVGQVVRVRVLEVNEALKRISLSMKGLSSKPKPRRKGQPKRQQPHKPQQEERTYTLEDLKSKFNNR